MAYKFQLGTARLSGSLVQEGEIKAVASALSGSSLSIGGTAVSATPAELNIVDGDATVGTGLLLDSHGFVHNSGSTMVQTQIVKIIEHGFAKISGDATVASGGALTIGAGKIEGSMLDANVAGDGVTVVSNAIKLNLNASGGLDVSGPGGQAGIKLGTNPGLQLAPGGLTVKVKTEAGLTLDGDGLSVNTLDLQGDGLSESSGVLQVNVHSSGGLDLNGPDGSVQIKLTDTQALTLAASGLDLKDTIGGNRTFSNNITIGGTLTVQGTTTSLDTTNLVINDNLIQLNAVTGSEGRTSNSGAGIFITGSLANGNNDVSLTCNADGGELKSSSGFDVATGKTYQINGSDVLSATALAATVIVDGDSLDISNCNNSLVSGDMQDADLMLVNDGDAGAVPKKATLGNLKTFFQTGVTADSAAKIKRTVNVSTGANMTISDDSMVDLFNITASATALIASSGFSAGDEINIKAGPLVSETIVLTISGAAPSGYTFDGFSSIQLESPNASVKLILEGTSNWMIF